VPAGLPAATAVAAGAQHSLALLADGGVRAWGRDDWGQCSLAEPVGPVASVAAGGGVSLLVIGARSAPCPSDLTGDGTVSGADLGILLGEWGTDGGATGADLNGSGMVSGADLGILLGDWGPCP
jgi:hypothetical protein